MSTEKKDAGKWRYDLIPPVVLMGLAAGFTVGVNKGYKDRYYLTLTDGQDRIYRALLSHLLEWRRSVQVDPEDGQLHLISALTNMAMLFDLEYGSDTPCSREDLTHIFGVPYGKPKEE